MKNIKISIFKTSIVILLLVYVLIQYQSRNNGRYTVGEKLTVFDTQTGVVYYPGGYVINLIEESKTKKESKEVEKRSEKEAQGSQELERAGSVK